MSALCLHAGRGPVTRDETRAVRPPPATAPGSRRSRAVLDATVTRLGEAGYAVKKMDLASPRTATASSAPSTSTRRSSRRLPRGRHAQQHRQDVPLGFCAGTDVCVRAS